MAPGDIIVAGCDGLGEMTVPVDANRRFQAIVSALLAES